jgi:hypothetical protein
MVEENHVKDFIEWLRYPTYKKPTWVGQSKQRGRFGPFDDYWLVQVRTRYTDLENEFVINVLPLIEDGMKESNRIQYTHTSFLLHQAREELQKVKPELITATTLLDQVERYVVWGYEIDALDARIDTFYAQLLSSKLLEKNEIRNKIESFRGKYKDIQKAKRAEIEKSPDKIEDIKNRWKYSSKKATYDLEAVMDESVNVMNRANLLSFINEQLQNQLFNRLIGGGIVLLLFLILISPLAINSQTIIGWPSLDLKFLPLAATYLNSLVIAMMGAGGAFLSGLLQARSSRITFAAYNESIKKLALRPVVGAIVALVLFVLLSWGVVPGFTVSNAGSYIFLVFVAGFSERFFLRIIQTESKIESDDQPEAKQLAGPVAGAEIAATNLHATNPHATKPIDPIPSAPIPPLS